MYIYNVNIVQYNKLIDKMSSNSSLIGNCYFMNGEYPSLPAWRAFDRNSETDVMSNSTGLQEDYLQYDFNNDVNIQRVDLHFENVACVFSDCKVTASADGINWDTIVESKEFNNSTWYYIFDVKEEYKDKLYKSVRVWQIGTRLGGGDNRKGITECRCMVNKVVEMKNKDLHISSITNVK